MTRASFKASAWALLAAALTTLLTACGSTPPTHYHSLLAPPPSPAPGAVARAVPAPPVRFEVLPVGVPVQVDVPQLVVRLPDDALTVLESERWAAPLGDEIRSLLTLRIERALAGVPAPAAGADRRWRVRVDVQRFDALLGRAATVQLRWSLQQVGAEPALRCLASYEQPVGAGAAALVAGARALFDRLGDTIGRAIAVAAGGGAPSCG
ncbi:MAG: membrane integrity-associated transporter subunit PqiC [Ideonella sp.]|nr:membrane integrity-associated transporter subunit PqiC [Ideonella sp.]MCC7456995.1 membrane integrity-associated transporter subunit PqiC [Nitrospira sp.]